MVNMETRLRTEQQSDLEAYEEAMAEYEADPVTYTLEEVEKELGIEGKIPWKVRSSE